MRVECRGCHSACCRFGVVPVTAPDVLRILEADKVVLSDFVHLERCRPCRTGVILQASHADSEWEYDWFLRQREQRDGASCVFLRHDDQGNWICSVYRFAPRICLVYPLRWLGPEITAGQAAFCPGDRVNTDGTASPESRRLLLSRRVQWFFQVHLATVWNRHVLKHATASRRMPPTLLGWMLDCAEVYRDVAGRYGDDMLAAWVPKSEYTPNPWGEPATLEPLTGGAEARRFVDEVLAALPAVPEHD